MDEFNKKELEEIHDVQRILDEISSLKYGDGVEDNLTFGEKLADKVVGFIGSWQFISMQCIILFLWVLWNAKLAVYGLSWDKYPFILLNLFLSFQAAFASPLILMSQNRSERRDRLRAAKAYDSIDNIEHSLVNILERIKTKKNGNGSNETKEEKTQSKK
jgi:uncharacterized membrane protein